MNPSSFFIVDVDCRCREVLILLYIRRDSGCISMEEMRICIGRLCGVCVCMGMCRVYRMCRL